jgi:hypothetical protein
MTKYVPFLKFKQNEIQGLGMLDFELNERIHPFFDIPRTSKNQSQVEIHERLDLGLKNFQKLTEKKGNFEFYVDNFDLNDQINLNGIVQYEYILSLFAEYRAIPVLALDRHAEHNTKALNYLQAVGGKVAIRLQLEDLESYAITKKKLEPLWPQLTAAGAQGVHMIIDGRVIKEPTSVAKSITNFLAKFQADFPTQRIIVTGSTIPSNITDLIGTNKSLSIPRQEYSMWRTVVKSVNGVTFGDYGVVSPDYSDAELDPRLLRTVSTPKAFYPYEDLLHAVRGSSFQNHPLGNGQYFSIAAHLEKQAFFREEGYSYGEKYIFQRSPKSAKKPAKAGHPGSWLKATLVSHITYITNSI